MRVATAALLTILLLAACAAENNCSRGTAVFIDKYIWGSELRLGPRDPTLVTAPRNEGIVTLTVDGKIENYYLTSDGHRNYVVNFENNKISSRIFFLDRVFGYSSAENARRISITDLQAVRAKLLPGSKPVGNDWSFKKCEPQFGTPPNPPARFIPLAFGP
jgi:hypothetical protein